MRVVRQPDRTLQMSSKTSVGISQTASKLCLKHEYEPMVGRGREKVRRAMRPAAARFSSSPNKIDILELLVR